MLSWQKCNAFEMWLMSLNFWKVCCKLSYLFCISHWPSPLAGSQYGFIHTLTYLPVCLLWFACCDLSVVAPKSYVCMCPTACYLSWTHFSFRPWPCGIPGPAFLSHMLALHCRNLRNWIFALCRGRSICPWPEQQQAPLLWAILSLAPLSDALSFCLSQTGLCIQILSSSPDVSQPGSHHHLLLLYQ